MDKSVPSLIFFPMGSGLSAPLKSPSSPVLLYGTRQQVDPQHYSRNADTWVSLLFYFTHLCYERNGNISANTAVRRLLHYSTAPETRSDGLVSDTGCLKNS